MVEQPPHWAAEYESKPAPDPLIRVQALVNTVERPDGADRLAGVGDAAPWLVEQGLLAAGADLTMSDLALYRDVREALRALLIANAGGPAPSEQQLQPLRRIASDGLARPEIAADGSVHLSSAGDGPSARLGGLLLIVRDAQRDGSWARLKACANDECHWAFYDRSRNHGGTWCDMSSCGNKLKNRDFRARRRAENG